METVNNIDELLDFDPNDQSVFDSVQTSNNNSSSSLFYRPNVKNSVASDKHYRSLIRIIYNPKDFNKSVVERTTYRLEDAQGAFFADSMLSLGGAEGKNCPIFKAWKKLRFSGKPELEIHAKGPDDQKWFKNYTKKNVLIQVINDANAPELNGKFLIWKLPKTVATMLDAKMFKPVDPKKKLFLMDYLIGPSLSLDITPAGPNEPEYKVDYGSSEFDTDYYQPIIATDGSQLLTDDEISIINSYADAKYKIIKARTPIDVEKGNATINELKDSIKSVFKKALSYVSDNAPDLVVEGGYHPWSEATTKRVNAFIAKAVQGIDPRTPDAMQATHVKAAPSENSLNFESQMTQPTGAISDSNSDSIYNDSDNDIPF